jgi:hypothetical protein
MGKKLQSQNKTVTICFRTTEDLREALERMGTEERRSLSSTIESILYQYLRDGSLSQRLLEEKRRHARKPVSVPALVRQVGMEDGGVEAGVVLDISLGGLQISVPHTFRCEIREDKEQARISVIFSLPDHKRPVTVQCAPRHIVPHDGAAMIGASFSDVDFESYQALQNYLIN